MTQQADNDGWIEFEHNGQRWSFDADQLALWDEEEQSFQFFAFHNQSQPTVESVTNFIGFLALLKATDQL